MTRRQPNYIVFIAVLLLIAAVAWAFNRSSGGHSKWVGAAAFSRDGTQLATAGGDVQGTTAEVLVWDVPSAKVKTRLNVESGNPRWLWFSDAAHLLMGCSVPGESITDYKPGEVTQIQIDEGTSNRVYTQPAVSGGTLPLSAAQKLIIFGPKSIRLRGVGDGPGMTLFNDNSANVNRIALSRNERFLTAAAAGAVHLWDLRTNERLPSLIADQLSTGQTAVSDDGNFVVASRYEFDFNADSFPLLFWDRSQDVAPVKEVVFPRAVTSLQMLPGDQPRVLVVSGKEHAECEVSIYDALGNQLQQLYKGTASVNSLVMTPDAKRIVWVDSDRQGEMWDVSGAEPERVWRSSLIEVTNLTISPDGKLIAGHGYSPDVWLFDTATGNVTARLKGYEQSQVVFYILSILPMLLMFAGIQWYRKKAAANRRNSVSLAAQKLGWQHTSGSLPDDIADFDFFKRRPGGSFEHVLLGREEEFHTLLAVYSWIQRTNDSSTTMQSMCVIYPHVASNLPDLFIRPEFLTDSLAEYVGFSDVDLDSSETLKRFSKLHLLRTTNVDQMPDVINESLAEYLCEHEGWNIEILEGSVLMHWQRVKSFTSGRFPVDDANGILAFVEEANAIVRLIVSDSSS